MLNKESSLASMWTSRAVGILLVHAGLLKAQWLISGQSQQDGFWFAAILDPSLMLAEILLGLWLVSGFQKRIAWWLAYGSFSVFLGVSLTRTVLQEEACGCFGKLHVPPAVTVVLDLVVLVLLAAFRPKRLGSWKIRVGVFLLGSILGVGVASVIAHLPDRLTENPGLELTPKTIDLGSLSPNEKTSASWKMTNRGPQIIRVLRIKTSCECLTAQIPENEIGPNQTVQVTIGINLNSLSGFRGKLRWKVQGYDELGKELFVMWIHALVLVANT